jgi:hypothetical protein
MADGPEQRTNPYARPTAYRYGTGQAPLRPGAGPAPAPAPAQRAPLQPTPESARSVVAGGSLAAPGAASVIPSLPTRPDPNAQRPVGTAQAPQRPLPTGMRPPAASPVLGGRPQPLPPLTPQVRPPLADAIPQPVIVPDPIAERAAEPPARPEAVLSAPIPGTSARKASAARPSGRMLALALLVVALIGLAAAIFMMIRAKPAPVTPPVETPAVAPPPAAVIPPPTVAPETPAATAETPALRGLQSAPVSQPATATPAASNPAAAKPAAAAPPPAAPAPAPTPTLDLAPAPLDLPPAPPPAAAKPPPPKLTPIPAPKPSNPDGPISTQRPN